MAGRPPNPTALQLLKGADKKNPKRIRERAGEPVPPDIKVQPPDEWTDFDSLQGDVTRLVSEKKTLNEIAIELNVSGEKADELKKRASEFVRANRMLRV